jgi:hypothetical protein
MRLQHRLSLPMIPRTVSPSRVRVRRSPAKPAKLSRYAPNRSRAVAVNSIPPSSRAASVTALLYHSQLRPDVRYSP